MGLDAVKNTINKVQILRLIQPDIKHDWQKEPEVIESWHPVNFLWRHAKILLIINGIFCRSLTPSTHYATSATRYEPFFTIFARKRQGFFVLFLAIKNVEDFDWQNSLSITAVEALFLENQWSVLRILSFFMSIRQQCDKRTMSDWQLLCRT